MGQAITGFFNKLFSTDSIVSRLIRAILLGIAGGAATGTIHLPSWAVAIIAALAGIIPAGQNQSAPATPSAKKAIPPTA